MVVWSLHSGGRVVVWALGVVVGWSPWCGGRVVARPLWPGGGGGGQRKAAAERPWRPAGSVCPQERSALLREEVAGVHCLLSPCCPSSARAGRPWERSAGHAGCAALRCVRVTRPALATEQTPALLVEIPGRGATWKQTLCWGRRGINTPRRSAPGSRRFIPDLVTAVGRAEEPPARGSDG